MTAFRDLNTTRKGELGEKIVERWLQQKGWVIYRPADDGQHHPVDCFATERRNPSNSCIVEMKAKPHRIKYPDTGVDLAHWRIYLTLEEQHQKPMFIAFVDEFDSEVYGNFLHKLEVPRRIRGIDYPRTENNGRDQIRYWPLCNMERNLCRLSPEIAEQLWALSTRSPEYERAYAELSRQTTMKF